MSDPSEEQRRRRQDRHEENHAAGRESGRIRLRRYVVEEDVAGSVPVRREAIRVEREPVDERRR